MEKVSSSLRARELKLVLQLLLPLCSLRCGIFIFKEFLIFSCLILRRKRRKTYESGADEEFFYQNIPLISAPQLFILLLPFILILYFVTGARRNRNKIYLNILMNSIGKWDKILCIKLCIYRWNREKRKSWSAQLSIVGDTKSRELRKNPLSNSILMIFLHSPIQTQWLIDANNNR